MPNWNTSAGRPHRVTRDRDRSRHRDPGRPPFQHHQATGQAIVRAAWDAGIRYVDTAPFYGVGAAEHRVGDALRGEDRDSWVLSTKVGRLLKPHPGARATEDGGLSPFPFDVVYDYSYDGIMRRSRTAISVSASRRSTFCSCMTSA